LGFAKPRLVVSGALSSNISDHATIHFSLNAGFRPKKRFKFEMYWLKLEGFDEAIKEAWRCDPRIVDPYRRLDALFRKTAEFFQSWGQRKTGNIKLQLAIANSVIFRLDAAQDFRVLPQVNAGSDAPLNSQSWGLLL
jgi:hypothetical protein